MDRHTLKRQGLTTPDTRVGGDPEAPPRDLEKPKPALDA